MTTFAERAMLGNSGSFDLKTPHKGGFLVAHGRIINTSRRRPLEYLPGPYADTYSARHPAFVSEYLRIAEGLEISRSELAAVYLEWVRDRFDPNFNRPFTYDLHNLYLHLIECQGVDEDEPLFRGVGLR